MTDAKTKKEVPFVDISALLEKGVRSRIYRVGIELEGGWKTVGARTTPKHDGSVFRREDMSEAELTALQLSGVRYHGELASTPMPLEEWKNWLKQHHPHHVDSTCGLHLHMSFRSALMYQRLMDPRYPATIVEFVSRWAKKKLDKDHHIFPRLAGKSRFCQHVFDADRQAANTERDFDQNRNGHRYTVINYCYSRYQTVECRLLPMFPDIETSTEALQLILDITSAFLLATAKIERPVAASWKVEEEPYKLERRAVI